MKKPVALAFLLGALFVGMSWMLWAENQPPREVTPHEPVIVTQTKIEEKVVYEHAATKECGYYLDSVDTLRAGQKDLSKIIGSMRNMISEMELNLMKNDPNTVVRMSRDMNTLENKAGAAWLKIGDAAAVLDQNLPGKGPCR